MKTDELEKARLGFIALMHEIFSDVVKGKEEIIGDLIDWAHKHQSQEPETTERVFYARGVTEVVDVDMVACEVMTNATGVTLQINGGIFPYNISDTPTYIVKGNTITSLTIKGSHSSDVVYVKFFNQKASLLR